MLELKEAPITKVIAWISRKDAVVALENQKGERAAVLYPNSKLAHEAAVSIMTFLDKLAVADERYPRVQLVEENLSLAEQVEFARRDPLVG